MSNRLQQMQSGVKAQLSADSRLLVHTTASKPKFPGEKPVVVPKLPSNIPTVGAVGNPDHWGAQPLKPQRTDSPSRRADHWKNFTGSAALACIRGGDLPASFTPPRSQTPTGSRRNSGDWVYVSNNSNNQQNNNLAPTSSIAPQESGMARPGSAQWAGGLRREVNKRLEHSKNIVFPSGPPPQECRGLWSAKALPNGSHIMLQKKRAKPPEVKEVDFFAAKTGKKILAPQGSIEGSGMQVTTDWAYRTPNRIEKYHHAGKAPFLTEVQNQENISKKSRLNVGLMGYNASGKKKIYVNDTGADLLWHRDNGWDVQREPRGTQLVAGKSHGSVVPWELGKYTPEELREKKFKPCSINVDGPKAFVPEPQQWRPASAPRGGRSPSRGMRHLDAGTSSIFPLGSVPNVPNPHSPAPPQYRGRSPGRFSPLRQRPPSLVGDLN